nr:MAG TPA: Polymerase, viral polymerase, cap-binding, viral [Caudoviricetes sp.]
MIREGIVGGFTAPDRYADGGAITSGTVMLGSGGQVTPRLLRKALDGVNVELTVDGQTTLTSRMRTIADASTVTAYRMSR